MGTESDEACGLLPAIAAKNLLHRAGQVIVAEGSEYAVEPGERQLVSQAQERIRKAVNRNEKEKLTALLHHVTVDFLRAAFLALKKRAAVGIDQISGSSMRRDSSLGSRTYTDDFMQDATEHCQRDGYLFRKRMANDGHSASQPWKTRSSRRRWSCF